MGERSNKQIYIGLAIALTTGAGMAWAGSDGGSRVASVPVFALCGALAFIINWLAFIPAGLFQTERYYDLTGGITYVSVTALAVTLSGDLDLRATLATAMVLIWSVRLATFLFLRISRAGVDSRFDNIKNRPLRFFFAWSLQGLWVLLTAATALAIITGGMREPFGAVGAIGFTVWLLGLGIEVVADRQKSVFRSNPDNEGRFISTGLWAWSRHPNYFGEIVLWTGMAIMALPVLHGWQWMTPVSPFFVWFLLTRVSGVPMLEEKSDQRWGGQSDYEAYKQRTPVLVPRPPPATG